MKKRSSLTLYRMKLVVYINKLMVYNPTRRRNNSNHEATKEVFMSIMPNQLAQHTVENYKCSRCWGFLVKSWVKGSDGQLEKSEEGEQLAEVKCRSCNEDLGFVSNTYIERERAKDFNYAYEVKRDLSRDGIITKEKAL